LDTAYKLATSILLYDHSKLDYAEYLFRRLVETPASLILKSNLDLMEMCDGLVDALKSKGTTEALEEAVCVAQGVVMGFQRHKGVDHPRTKRALADLHDVETRWRKSTKGEMRAPRESQWLQKLRGGGPDRSQQAG
jgi:hypothetical protein